MPTIRIDEDVYDWLKSLATPFEDNPNSVLRRVAKLDEGATKPDNPKNRGLSSTKITGNELTKEYGLDVKFNVTQSRYSQNGNWYENLTSFPGALWDSHGYIVFQDVLQYERCHQLNIGKKLNVSGSGISSVAGYTRVR